MLRFSVKIQYWFLALIAVIGSILFGTFVVSQEGLVQIAFGIGLGLICYCQSRNLEERLSKPQLKSWYQLGNIYSIVSLLMFSMMYITHPIGIILGGIALSLMELIIIFISPCLHNFPDSIKLSLY
jgi:hypothetical protein